MSEGYTAYGLVIRSDIALPELHRASDTDTAPPVTVGIGRVDPGGLDAGAWMGPFLCIRGSALWLDVPAVARFLIADGRTITVDPAPGVDEDSVRVFLLGSALGALLFQRGYLVMHGNAVRIGQSCLLCVGPSGAGKSTLAGAFLRRGFDVIADDVVPVDALGRALPGFPRIKLWQDAADRLAVDTAPLARIRPGFDKFNLPIGGRHTLSALPIRWVYELHGDGERDGVSIEPVRGMERFTVLRNNTYRVHYLDGMGLKAEHLRLCASLSSRIGLSRLHRPRSGADLNGMIDRILQDIGFGA